MKTFSIILIFGFAWQTTDAESRYDKIESCVLEISHKHKYPDIPVAHFVRAIGHPGQAEADELKNFPQEIIADVFACLHQKLFPKENLNDHLQSLIRIDDKVSEMERQRMRETLSACNTNAAGNNTKLLSCVNLVFSPFADLMAIIVLDARDYEYRCLFSKCKLTIGEVYKVYENKGPGELALLARLLRVIDSEQKSICLVGCLIDSMDLIKSRNESAFVHLFSDHITQSTRYNENEKKEMLGILNMCKPQATGDDKTEKLFQCINITKPPFADFAFA